MPVAVVLLQELFTNFKQINMGSQIYCRYSYSIDVQYIIYHVKLIRYVEHRQETAIDHKENEAS